MADPTASEIIRVADDFRRRLLLREASAAERIVEAYRRVHARLIDAVSGLQAEIAAEEIASADAVRRLGRYQRLLEQTRDEMDRYLDWLETEIRDEAEGAIALGSEAAFAQVEAPIPVGERSVLSSVWNRLPSERVEQLLGFLSPQGPLVQRLEELAPLYTDAIGEALVNGIAQGLNPRQVGREIARVSGLALTDAMRQARTAQLWAYREASRAQYQENGDIVSGWTWYAELDSRVCMSCVAMHGSFHSSSEVLDDHWNGRCRPLPAVNWSALGVSLPPLDYGPSGEEWFRSLSAEQQKAMLGPGRYEGWRNGMFPFDALSRQVQDRVYGQMRVETPLNQLVA